MNPLTRAQVRRRKRVIRTRFEASRLLKELDHKAVRTLAETARVFIKSYRKRTGKKPSYPQVLKYVRDFSADFGVRHSDFPRPGFVIKTAIINELKK